MTGPQRELLDTALFHERYGWGPVRPTGPRLRVAERLATMGLVEMRIGGSGQAWKAPWWFEIVLTELGRREARIASDACE